MSALRRVATRPAALRADIRTVERRIRRRRENIGVAVDGMAHRFRNRMLSPTTLVAAGFFGAALHHSQRLHAFRLLAILQTTNAGLRLLLTATSRSSATPDQA